MGPSRTRVHADPAGLSVPLLVPSTLSHKPPNTHTLEDKDHANPCLDQSPSATGQLSPEDQSTSTRLLSTLVPFPSLSPPETDLSRCTEAVSSMTLPAQPR